MKTCPFCAEEIQDAAIKCKHCGSMLDGSDKNSSSSTSPSAQPLLVRGISRKYERNGFLLILVGLTMAAVAGHIGDVDIDIGARIVGVLLFAFGFIVFLIGRFK